MQPEYTAVETDRENMYNNSCRVATFEALHEYDPECKPVYRMLYGGEADIFVDRTSTGSLATASRSGLRSHSRSVYRPLQL